MTGFRQVVALILRRDRVWLPAWIVGNVTLTAVTAAAVQSTLATPEALASYENTVYGSAATLLMAGRGVALDTVGGVTVNETSFAAILLVALMTLFGVVRHTRADEEAGRTELVRAGAIGRDAPIAAALAVLAAASTLTAVLTSIVLVSLGLDPSGSIAFGTAVACVGIAFATCGLIAAQVASSARSALGAGTAALGLAFLVRGIGAVNDSWLVWVSPIGWAQNIDAFGEERWWIPALFGAASAAGFAAAAALGSRRDLGSGLFTQRAGRSHGSRLLGSQFGLAMRQQRGLIAGWGVGLTALAAVYGAVAVEVPRMLKSMPEIAKLIGADGPERFLDAYLSYSFLFIASVLSAFLVVSVLRLRSDELNGRAEMLLSGPTSRISWAIGTLSVSLIAAAAILAASGLCAGVAYAVADRGSAQASDHILNALGDAMAQFPAVAVVGAIAFAVWGWTGTAFGWLYATFAMVDSFLGDLLKLPGWIRTLSPFRHSQGSAAASTSPMTFLALAAAAAVFITLGLNGVRRRDIRAA